MVLPGQAICLLVVHYFLVMVNGYQGHLDCTTLCRDAGDCIPFLKERIWDCVGDLSYLNAIVDMDKGCLEENLTEEKCNSQDMCMW